MGVDFVRVDLVGLTRVSYKCIQHLNCCSNSNLMLKVKCLGTGLGYAYHYAFSHFTHYVVVRF